MSPMTQTTDPRQAADAPAPEPTDNELAIRWRDGNTQAYNELVARHLDAVHRYVRIRCGNDADTADICQEVFLEICLKIANFNPDHPFGVWLFTIARHKTADHFRKRRPAEEFDPGRHGGADTTMPSAPIEQYENARDAWRKVFRTLPENHATALWLRVQGRMALARIAETLDTSESNVKVMLFRARQKLAKEWHSDDSTQTSSIP